MGIINILQTIMKQLANNLPLRYSHLIKPYKSLEVIKMSKKNFISLILGTIGGILFALGMCMAMIAEWDAFSQGIVVGCIGLVILIIMALVRRKMEGKSIIVKLSGKTIGTVVLGVAGALVLGIGMCMVMVWNMLIQGIVIGLAGILLLLCLIPLVIGIK